MRRCKDDWVNATQVLKCCNFPKAKRTKILEKGVQQGLHEKIQGGYGRFQGTWIPLADAQQLAALFGITPEMAPVLFFDSSNPPFELHAKTKEKNKDGTPMKRKYVKRKKVDEGSPKKPKLSDSQSFNDMNPTESFGSLSRMPSQMSQYSNGSNMPVQYPVNSFNQSDFMMNNNSLPGFSGQNQLVPDYQNYQMQMQQMQLQMQMQQQQQQQQQQQPQQRSLPPPQRQQSQQPSQQLSFNNYGYQPQNQLPQVQHPHLMGQFHHSKLSSSQSTNDTNWSHDENNKDSDTSMSSNEEVRGKPKETYSSQLLKFFSEENGSIPYFIQNPPYDFNINEAIDDEGHTPLHWAASIGNYLMIHLLTSKGANPLVVNNYGLNPLSKLISFNNCFELKNFPKVLDDLEVCLINTDINGRTPLHYLCQFSKVASKYESLRYYLGIILNKLTSLTNQNSSNKSINLIKNVLDHQDVNGDTCLHLAAKAGCSKLVKLLLSYDARDDLLNANQETAKYVIIKEDLLSSKEGSVPLKQELVNDDNMDYSQDKPIISPGNNYPNNPEDENMDVTNENPRGNGKEVNFQVPTSHGNGKYMSTPTRSNIGSLETPDTQRTTVEDDDDFDDRNHARVNKEQLNHLMRHGAPDDDKENIFLDSLKPFDSMSTPVQASKSNSYLSNSSHQPLAVISERTAESSPMATDNYTMTEASRSSHGHSSKMADVQSYSMKPPKFNEDGKLIEENDDDEQEKQIPTDDLSAMFGNMIGALTKSYKQSLTKLTTQETKTKEQLATKEIMNETLTNKIMLSLSKVGIEDFNSLTEAYESVAQYTDVQAEIVGAKENSLTNYLEKFQAYQLANLVSHNEENVANDELPNDKQTKIKLAIELTNSQISRSKLLNNLTDNIKGYGVDDKMYKYRKLISLSCGLKVDEIDGLIDGIEESLMETALNRS